MWRWLSRVRVVVRSIVRPAREERELQEELHDHLQRQIDEGLRAGLSPDDARFAAMRAMGAIEKSQEECRDLRSTNWIRDFWGDLRYSARGVRRPIVGVLPPEFHYPRRTDVWSNQPNRANVSRTSHSFLAVGRLEPGVSIDQAQPELDTIAAGLEQYPENKGRGVAAVRLPRTPRSSRR